MAMLAEQTVSKEQSSLKLELTRVIKASKQRVFDAWTRPEFIRQWFGPKDRTVEDVQADLHAGGQYKIDMSGAQGAVGGSGRSGHAAVSGRYVKVVPYDLLQFTWTGSWNPDEETLVTIKLRDVDGGTELKLTQERFMTETSRAQHEQGWAVPLEKMVELSEAK